LVETFAVPGGDYLSLGQSVDLEVEVHIFIDRKGIARYTLRACARAGDF
jgi:hypothetical protein